MDIDYDALFEVESAKTEDVADTPAEETAEQTEETAGEKESEPAEQTEQSKEDNAKYAAIRRKAEADAQKAVDDTFAASGLTNPYTGKPILNKADFEEYAKAVSKEKVDGILDKTGMTEDEFKQMVDELPDVKAAKKAKADYERQQQKITLDAQMAEVTKLNPDIKSVADLQKLDSYQTIYQYVLRGLSIPDAYKLANFDSLSGKTSAAAKQAAINAKAGKDHLTQTASRGEGAQSVPADVAEMYRAFNPKATEAEILAHYNKHHKKG